MANFKKSIFLEVTFSNGEFKTFPFGTTTGVANAVKLLTKIYSPADVKKIEYRVVYEKLEGEVN